MCYLPMMLPLRIEAKSLHTFPILRSTELLTVFFFVCVCDCTGLLVHHVGSFIATCEFLVVPCEIQFPDQGLKTWVLCIGSMESGAWSLSHWTTREVPCSLCFKTITYLLIHYIWLCWSSLLLGLYLELQWAGAALVAVHRFLLVVASLTADHRL